MSSVSTTRAASVPTVSSTTRTMDARRAARVRRSIRPGSRMTSTASAASSSTGKTHQNTIRPLCGVITWSTIAVRTARAIGQRCSGVRAAAGGVLIAPTPVATPPSPQCPKTFTAGSSGRSVDRCRCPDLAGLETVLTLSQHPVPPSPLRLFPRLPPGAMPPRRSGRSPSAGSSGTTPSTSSRSSKTAGTSPPAGCAQPGTVHAGARASRRRRETCASTSTGCTSTATRSARTTTTTRC